MDPSPDRSDPGSPGPASARFLGDRKLWLALVAVILLAAIFIITTTSSPKQELVWLPPAVLSRAMQPSVFTRLKYNLIRLTAPLWRWHRSRRPSINVNAKLVELVAGSAQIQLGPPTATNADGTCAWIISHEDFSALRQRIMPPGGSREITQTSITVYNGGPARATLGPGGMYTPANGPSVPLGLTVDVVPSLARHSIRLVIGATYIKAPNPPQAKLDAITNFSAACRALIPSGGGLLLQNIRTHAAQGTNYLLLISPTALDLRGNPVKL